MTTVYGIQTEEKESRNTKISTYKTKQEEMRKHGDNIYTIFEYTNATPIRCQNDFGYACCFCSEFYTQPHELKNHTILSHDFEMKNSFMEGKRVGDYLVKLDITGLQCNICSLRLNTLEEAMCHLRDHKKTIHFDINNHIIPFDFEGEELKCTFCKMIFNKFKKLLEHMNRHYRNCVCDICGAGFVNRSTFTVHYHGHQTGCFPCQYCQKVFDTKRKQKSHELAVHVKAKKTYKCVYCNDHFSTHWSKERHIAGKHGVNLREIKCHVCGKTCLTANSLRIHLKRDHLKERRYECSVCGYKFFGSQELKDHMLKHTGVKKYQCDVCSKCFGKKTTLREHIRIHTDDRRFKCELCPQAFIQKCSLKNHLRSKHDPGKAIANNAKKGERSKHMDNITTLFEHTNATPIRSQRDVGYGCCFCRKFYKEPSELKDHTRKSHQADISNIMRGKSINDYLVKLDITGLQCNICNMKIDNLEDMMSHLKGHKKAMHLDINNHIMPFNFEGEELKCAICKVEFNKFKKMIEHMNRHYRNRVCDVCGAGFINEKSFQIHLQGHKTGEFPCKYCQKVYDTLGKKKSHESAVHVHSQMLSKCGYCNKKFKSHRNKEKHISSVHGVKLREIKCHICGKVCLTMNALRVHTRRDHLKERPYECHLCDFKSYGSNCLKSHMLKHTGIRDFQCDICLKAYSKKKTLREHMRIHADDRRFKCEQCGLTFIQKCSLNGHIRSKHKDLACVND